MNDGYVSKSRFSEAFKDVLPDEKNPIILWESSYKELLSHYPVEQSEEEAKQMLRKAVYDLANN